MLLILIFLLLFSMLIVYGIFFERYKLRIKYYEFSNIPGNIALICDLHIRNDMKIYHRLMEHIKNNEIEYIFIAGDTFEKVRDHSFLSSFENYKTYAVFGNNDHQKLKNKKRHEEILKIFKIHNIQVLFNQSVKIKEEFTLIGIDDPHKKKDDVKLAFKDIDKKRKNFVMVHSPEANSKIMKYDPDFIFYGHTHGGQIRLPLIGSLFNNTRKCLSIKPGIKRIDKTVIVHSVGIGTTLFPIRLFNPPEIIILIKK